MRLKWLCDVRPVGIGSQRVSIAGDGTLEIQAVRAADVGDYACALVSPGGEYYTLLIISSMDANMCLFFNFN